MFRSKVLVLSLILTIELVNSRVLYLDTPRSNNFPVYPDEGGTEQASRDLDVTFSAGESAESEEQGVYPRRKPLVYPPGQSIYDLARDPDRPIYHRIPDVPVRRVVYVDAPPSESNRKPTRLNNSRKGEVVLELRVIANNNNEI